MVPHILLLAECILIFVVGIFLFSGKVAHGVQTDRLADLFKPSFGHVAEKLSWRNKKSKRKNYVLRWRLGTLEELAWNVSSITEPNQAYVCLRKGEKKDSSLQSSVSFEQVQWYAPSSLNHLRVVSPDVPNVTLELVSSTSTKKGHRVSVPFPRVKPLKDSDSWFCTVLTPCNIWSALRHDTRLDTRLDTARDTWHDYDINLKTTRVQLALSSPSSAGSSWEYVDIVLFLGHHSRRTHRIAKELRSLKNASEQPDLLPLKETPDKVTREKQLQTQQRVEDSNYVEQINGLFSVDAILTHANREHGSIAAKPSETALKHEDNTGVSPGTPTRLETTVSQLWEQAWGAGFPLLTSFPFVFGYRECDGGTCQVHANNTLGALENVTSYSVSLDVLTSRPYCDVMKQKKGVAVLFILDPDVTLNPLRGIQYYPTNWKFLSHHVKLQNTVVPSVMSVGTNASVEIPQNLTIFLLQLLREKSGAEQSNNMADNPSLSSSLTKDIANFALRQTTLTSTTVTWFNSSTSDPVSFSSTTKLKKSVSAWLIVASAGALSCGLGVAITYACWNFFKQPTLVDVDEHA